VNPAAVAPGYFEWSNCVAPRPQKARHGLAVNPFLGQPNLKHERHCGGQSRGFRSTGASDVPRGPPGIYAGAPISIHMGRRKELLEAAIP